jgi:hypothetical protein
VKNLNNTPKFSLDKVFMNVNLDDITCVQKIEYPIQVAFRLNLIIEKDLNLNLNLVLGLHYNYTVAFTVTLEVSQHGMSVKK